MHGLILGDPKDKQEQDKPLSQAVGELVLIKETGTFPSFGIRFASPKASFKNQQLEAQATV